MNRRFDVKYTYSLSPTFFEMVKPNGERAPDLLRCRAHFWLVWYFVIQSLNTKKGQQPIYIFFILYCDQPIDNYFTNYHTPTCFDTIVSSSESV